MYPCRLSKRLLAICWVSVLNLFLSILIFAFTYHFMIMTYVFVVSYNFFAVLLKYLLCFFPSEDPM